MSYRSRSLQYTIIERIGPSYMSNGIVYSPIRSFKPGSMLMLFGITPGSPNIIGTVTRQSSPYPMDDIIYTSSYTLNDTNLTNLNAIWDHSDTAGYAYDSTTTVSANTEIPLITFNLGASQNGFIRFVWGFSASGTSQYMRIYTSPDNSTWTKQIEVTNSDTNRYVSASYTTNTQYIQIRYYNGSSSSSSVLGQIWGLEFYPQSKFRNVFVVPDNNVDTYLVFVYNAYYQVLEAIPV